MKEVYKKLVITLYTSWKTGDEGQKGSETMNELNTISGVLENEAPYSKHESFV